MLLLFSAQSCYACSKLKGYLDLKGVEYRYIDVDINSALAAKFMVRALPTLVSINEEEHEQWRIVGFSVKEVNKKLGIK